MNPQILDSGKRQDFDTGSRRDTNEGKGRCDLLPPAAILRLAVHLQEGSKKYGDRNWELGQPLSRYIDAAQRHIFKGLMGCADEPHFEAAFWNLMAFLDTRIRIKAGLLPDELDDMPADLDPNTCQRMLDLTFPYQKPSDNTHDRVEDTEENSNGW